MEEHLHNSPKLGYPADGDDAKYVSGLSTILVATIQEAKDRISQIEYIFCSQLYPNFQSRSKILQKINSDAKKAAEDAWKEKENVLSIQLEKLQLQKQQAIDENKFLKLENEKQLKEQEEKMNLLLAELSNQQNRVDELERQLRRKSKEVDEGMELQKKLLLLVQSKETTVVNRVEQLKEHEEKTNMLLAKLNSIDKQAKELQGMLREKTEEAAKGKELSNNLLKKIEAQSLEILNYEELLNDNEKEKKLLKAKLEPMKEKVDRIQEELRTRAEEVEEGRKLLDRLLQQADQKDLELFKNKQQLKEHKKEKTLLLAQLKCYEEKVIQQPVNISEQKDEMAEGLGSYKKLLQEFELRTSELQAEKKKKRDAIDAYKRLKSQYTFLCSKFGLSTENIVPQNRCDDGSGSSSHHQNQIISPGFQNKVPEISAVASDMNTVKAEPVCDDNLGNDKIAKVIQASSSNSPTSSLSAVPKCHSNIKSAPVAGTKRPASYWRETRSHQYAGPDPHDDFLDTPCENIRRNLNKIVKENHEIPGLVPRDKNCDSLDDETQDINANPSPKKQQQAQPNPVATKGGFKYVEPVRKKAERETLKGVECKQCKKFYDAVLPDDEGNDNNDNDKRNFRCEHHDGVSRHRYSIPHVTKTKSETWDSSSLRSSEHFLQSNERRNDFSQIDSYGFQDSLGQGKLLKYLNLRGPEPYRPKEEVKEGRFDVGSGSMCIVGHSS